MAGLGRTQTDFHGFPVAHLADQDHFGSLAQSGAQPVGVGVEINPQLPLVERG